MLRPVAVCLCVVFAPAAAAVETLRISLGLQEDRLMVQGDSLSYGADVDEAVLTPAARAALSVRNVKGRLYLGEAPWMEEAIRIRAGAQTHDAGVPGSEAIKVGDLEVRGDLVIRAARGGRLAVVNVVALEDYLAAVLGSEMPRSFPDEALKAQAVAARTYALHKKLAAYDADFHLGASVLHQVYGGVSREDERTRAAVEATRGEVLTFELAPAETYFHASCGGQTESGQHALARDLPYLRPVRCGCGALKVTQWSLALSEEELRSKFPGASALEPVGRTSTGRVREVRLGNATLDAVRFRARLGYSTVRSLQFSVERAAGGGYALTGRGSGHGAGLCQWGAKVYADQGWSYRQILAHYYPGTELQRLY